MPLSREFGACGGIPGESFGPAVAVGGTVACQFLDPCGAIEDGLLVGGILLTGAAATWEMSKGGTQNVVPSWAAGSRPLAGESASQMADRLCKAQYPPDGAGCGTGPTSERNRIAEMGSSEVGNLNP